MANLVLNGDISGSVTLQVPTVAGSTVVTMPNTTGTLLVAPGGSYLGVTQGGTGVGTIPANAVVLGNGTGAVQSVAPGTAGNVLTSNGSTWESQFAPSPGDNTSPFYYNARTVSTNTTIGATENVMSAGPIIIADGVTVTVEDGGEWVIV